MKPAYLQAGIPLAISVAGFALARILSWRTNFPDPETQSDVGSELDRNDELGFQFQDLKERIEELQSRELELELRFLRYCIAKEKESELMDAMRELAIESARAEFLNREVEFLEAEKQTFKGLVEACWKIVQKLELSERKVAAMKAEVSRCAEEKENGNRLIQKLEDEVADLQRVVDRLREEKDELMLKLESSASSSSARKNGEEGFVSMEDYNRLANELDQARRDQVAEITEVSYLRWTNACLRHELMRGYQQQESGREDGDHGRESVGGMAGTSRSDQHQHQQQEEHGSRRKKLLKKLKRWVEGCEDNKHCKLWQGKHERKSIGWVAEGHGDDDDDGEMVRHRRSCSSF